MVREAGTEGQQAWRFTSSYEEWARLADGTPVHLRFVRPSDKELLRAGFQRLSAASRYRRFFGSKRALSEQDLEYLTRIDGVRHVAIGAARVGPDGVDQGLGVARFVCLDAEPNAAEAAIVVTDEWQRRGLGVLLLKRLVLAARERGIEFFTAHVQRANTAMRALLASVPGLEIKPFDDETLQVRVRLPELGSAGLGELPRDSGLYRLFHIAGASGGLFERNGEGQ